MLKNLCRFNDLMESTAFSGCIDKYIDILDAKSMTELLKRVYAGIHDRHEDDEDLQDFFKSKCWI